MTHRLWFKLIAAFALIIAVGVIVTVVLTREGTASQFAHFMVGGHMIRPARMQQLLAEFYREHEGWRDLARELELVLMASSDGAMSGMMGGMMSGMMGMADNRMQVLNTAGQVVADSAGFVDAAPLPLAQRWPIVIDGQEVGVLLVEGSMMGHGDIDDGRLLVGVTRSVLIAGLMAGGVALLLAGLIVRQITRPLASLTRASGRIAAGDLQVRVPVQSRDELGELATTFNRMAEILETQERLRRNMMADIAHELRTPLAAIQGTVEALQDGIFPLIPENLASIHEEATLLNRLIEDLRTLAHAEAGELSIEMESLDLAELARNEIASFQPQALALGICLTLEASPELPQVVADSQRLAQVMANLLNNALRHTPAGGAVRIEIKEADDGVQLAVIDTGEGIAPDDFPRVFDRFYRADRSRSRASGGSGLGLAIARQLMEAQGGRIWAESPPAGQDRGSGFYLQL
jgi:two-component system OmpR family sensor kinase/two-component system sensor histidine kinase BaeS